MTNTEMMLKMKNYKHEKIIFYRFFWNNSDYTTLIKFFLLKWMDDQKEMKINLKSLKPTIKRIINT